MGRSLEDQSGAVKLAQLSYWYVGHRLSDTRDENNVIAISFKRYVGLALDIVFGVLRLEPQITFLRAADGFCLTVVIV